MILYNSEPYLDPYYDLYSKLEPRSKVVPEPKIKLEFKSKSSESEPCSQEPPKPWTEQEPKLEKPKPMFPVSLADRNIVDLCENE